MKTTPTRLPITMASSAHGRESPMITASAPVTAAVTCMLEANQMLKRLRGLPWRSSGGM